MVMRALCLIRKEPYYRRQAFEKGLQRVGFKLLAHLTPEGPEDWLIIWNRKKGRDEAQADAWEAQGGTVIVAENGYLQKVDKTIYAISVHGHNGSGWFPVGDEDRFTQLGFAVKRWTSVGSEIVIRGQRGVGSVMMASPALWAEKLCSEMRRRTTLPLRVVPHPGNHAPKVPPERELKDAFALLTWCSSMGVLALTCGVPVFYAAPRWICSEGGSPLSQFPVLNRNESHRVSALHHMSHGQWHFNEIETGEPFARIIAHRKEAVW